MTYVLDEAIALFDNGNYSGQTVKKMLRELKEKKPGEPVQCPHWLIGRVAGIDGDTNEYFCNAQSERGDSPIDLTHIREDRRGCLTCLNPECPVWQAADQNCWKSMEQHDKDEREKVLDELVEWIKEYQSGRDSAYMEVVLTPVLEKIAELRKGGRE